MYRLIIRNFHLSSEAVSSQILAVPTFSGFMNDFIGLASFHTQDHT